jgi:DNA-binding SARP family transcriptional activator
MLQILMFGAFDLRRDDRSVCVVWKRHASKLLALLTLNRNRTLQDEWVIAALGIPESALPQAISELYRVLGEDRARLRHGNHQLFFDATGIEVDAFTFDSLISRADRGSLEQAVALYRGELLKGWQTGWLSEEREAYVAAYLDALDTLSGMEAKEGHLDRAASYLRRYVDIYPQMDSAWARLVEIYARAGQTAAVAQLRERYLRQFQNRSEDGERGAPSQRVLAACARALNHPPESGQSAAQHSGQEGLPARAAAHMAEPIGGTMPLDSPFYIERPADGLALDALRRSDSFILIKGSRQVGKSSLLARLARSRREAGALVIRTDLHKSPRAVFETAAALLTDVADNFIERLDLHARARSFFSPGRTPTLSFESFLRRAVFPAIDGQLVWIVDGVDRLLERDYRDDVFAMLRSWHNERANDADAKWSLLTVVLAYATDPYLFVKNQDQSPFNVGTPLDLDDFTISQVGELNRLYGSPLADQQQLDALYNLVGGHPYLVRRCLQEMALQGTAFDDLERAAASGGLCADHLERLRLAVQRDPETLASVKARLTGSPLSYERFVTLRAAGVARGSSPADARFRCRLYEIYLARALL